MKDKEKTFKEKWQDKKYQAKVKLSGYGIFVLITIIIIIFGQSSNNTEYNNINSIKENSNIISKPNVNNYAYKIEIITEKDGVIEEFYYYGKVKDAYEELTKKIDEKEYNYKIIDDKYYLLNNNNYILTTKEEVYDILDYNYLNIDNLNNYLSYSNFVDNEYQVYLKDIILDSNIDEYITIVLKGDTISVDYTNLINNLNNEEYNSYIVNIIYEE